MKIKKLEIINFRGFDGEHKIDLSVDEDKSVTLIIAENGTGKTAFLEAIMWCLHGKLPKDSDDVENIICMHSVKKDARAQAEVRLTILDDKATRSHKKPEYLISRILKKNSDETKPKIWIRDRTRRGGLTEAPGNHKLIIERLLPERLTPYFLFRGEGLKDWFRGVDEGPLKRSIEDMFGLTFATQASIDLKEYYEDLDLKIIKGGKATVEEKKAKSRLEKYKNNRDALRDQSKEIKDSHSEVTTKLKKVNDQINKSGHDLIEAKNTENLRLEGNLISLGKSRDALLKDRREILDRNGFHVLTFELKDSLSKFFDENEKKGIIPAPYDEITLKAILKTGLCICGRPVSEHSPEEAYIRSSFDEAGNEFQTNNKALIKNLFKEYSYRNKRVREVYEEKDNAINEVEGTIAENERKIDENIEDINNADKAKDIEDLIDQQVKLQSEHNNLLIKEGQLSSDLKDIEKKIKDEQAVINRASGGRIDPEVRAKKEFIENCYKGLVEEIERLTSEGRIELGNKLQEICEKYNRKSEFFEFANDNSYIPKIKDSSGLFLPQNDGTQVQTAIYYALALIDVCVERSKLGDGIVEPGTIAPMVCDAVFSALDPVNTGSVTQMLASVPEQTILLINSGSYEGECRKELIKSKKVGKSFYLQRKQPKVEKNLSTMTINGKKYQAFIKSKETSSSFQVLTNY